MKTKPKQEKPSPVMNTTIRRRLPESFQLRAGYPRLRKGSSSGGLQVCLIKQCRNRSRAISITRKNTTEITARAVTTVPVTRNTMSVARVKIAVPSAEMRRLRL